MKLDGTILIVISLVFAGLIMAAAYFQGENEQSQVFTHLLIALWWIPFSYFSGRSGHVHRCGFCRDNDDNGEEAARVCDEARQI